MSNYIVGELYYDTFRGLLTITEVFETPQTENGRYNPYIAKAEYVIQPDKIVKVFENTDRGFRLATDEDVKSYLLDCICCHDIGGDNKVAIHEDAVYLSNKDEWISLTLEEVQTLRKILNREISNV